MPKWLHASDQIESVCSSVSPTCYALGKYGFHYVKPSHFALNASGHWIVGLHHHIAWPEQQWEDLSGAHARHTCKRWREPCKVVDSWWKFLMLLHSIHPSLCGSSFVRHNWHVMTHHRRRSLQQKLVTRSCGNYQNHVKRCRNHQSFLVCGNSLCFNSN